MKTNNTEFEQPDKQSPYSNALSLTCSLILVTMLIRSSESSSALLHATLVIWLIHVTLMQAYGSTDLRKLLSSCSSDKKSPSDAATLSSCASRSEYNVDSSGDSAVPESSKSVASKALDYLAPRAAKSFVLTGTLFMKLGGFRDNTLRSKTNTSQFYRECWIEDIALRKNAIRQMTFGLRCLGESVIFVYEDGFLSRHLKSKLKLLRR